MSLSFLTLGASAAAELAPTATAASSARLLDALAWLVVIVLLILGLARLLQASRRRVEGSARMQVVSSLSLGQKEKLVLVEVDGRYLMLGATAHSITHLHTLEVDPDCSQIATGEDDAQKGVRAL